MNQPSDECVKRAREIISKFISAQRSESQAKLYGGLEQASEIWPCMETTDPDFLVGLIATALQEARDEGVLSVTGHMGGNRECGHFVMSVLSFCPVCSLLAARDAEIAKLKAEVNRLSLPVAVTEEILRRADGYIHVGHGCELAIRGTSADLAACREALRGASDILQIFNTRGPDDAMSFRIGKIMFENMDKLRAIDAALTEGKKETGDGK